MKIYTASGLGNTQQEAKEKLEENVKKASELLKKAEEPVLKNPDNTIYEIYASAELNAQSKTINPNKLKSKKGFESIEKYLSGFKNITITKYSIQATYEVAKSQLDILSNTKKTPPGADFNIEKYSSPIYNINKIKK